MFSYYILQLFISEKLFSSYHFDLLNKFMISQTIYFSYNGVKKQSISKSNHNPTPHCQLINCNSSDFFSFQSGISFQSSYRGYFIWFGRRHWVIYDKNYFRRNTRWYHKTKYRSYTQYIYWYHLVFLRQ
jgi:hypothetical protein